MPQLRTPLLWIDDELMYWSQYRGASGFQVWVLGQGVRAELLDPAGGVVADQVLATLHRS